MRYIRQVIGLLALAAAAPAEAQDTERAPAKTVPSTSLDAYRHHQPTAKDVEERELDRGKAQNGQQQRREQSDLDQLYKDIMRNSAPGQGTAPR
jgi:hypothetical protein